MQDPQRQLAAAARARLGATGIRQQSRPPDHLPGPLNGTRPSGVPVNAAMDGIRINGFAVRATVLPDWRLTGAHAVAVPVKMRFCRPARCPAASITAD